MSDDDDLSRFNDEKEPVKPIDISNPGQPSADKLRSLIGESTRREKAAPEEFIDPIRDQQARERKLAEERKKRIEGKDENVPEHMVEHVVEDSKTVGKGAYIDLLKIIPSLRSLHVGMGWDQKAVEAEPVDIDLSVFLLNKNDMTREDGDFVFYNHLTACEGAVKHEGDNRTGAGDGDDEIVTIDLHGVPYDILKILFVVSVYDEDNKGNHLGMVRNLFLRLNNREDGSDICRFNLDDDSYAGMTGIYLAALVREGPRWYFQTFGEMVERGGLATIASKYGIIVRELQSTG